MGHVLWVVFCWASMRSLSATAPYVAEFVRPATMGSENDNNEQREWSEEEVRQWCLACPVGSGQEPLPRAPIMRDPSLLRFQVRAGLRLPGGTLQNNLKLSHLAGWTHHSQEQALPGHAVFRPFRPRRPAGRGEEHQSCGQYDKRRSQGDLGHHVTFLLRHLDSGRRLMPRGRTAL